MERKAFIRLCGATCIGIMAGGSLLQSCANTKYIFAPINGAFLEVDPEVFKTENGFLKHVVIQNERLQYPISIFRNAAYDYTALYMRCTHQGTELQVFGDRLQCPAHGSEFTNTGEVQNGPADKNLRSFPVIVENNLIKIDLS